MENLKSFIIKLAFLMVIIETLTLFWIYFAISDAYISPAMPFIPPFFMAFTFLIHNALYKQRDKEFKYFQRTFMLMTTIKIFAMIIVLGVYVFINPAEAIPFSIAFLINYLAFTFFEARALLLTKNK